MSKELAKKESTEVAAQAAMMDAFGPSPMSARDIVIPKLLAMQGLSELVTEGKAKFGDLAFSSGEVIGNINTAPVDFIPFLMEKIWITSKKQASGKYEFDRIESITTANEDKQFEDGVFKNEYCYKFYCLNPKDMSLPFILQCKGTSRRTGQAIATQMYITNVTAGLTPASKVFALSGTKESNDNGTYVVLKANVTRNSTNEEVLKCIDWLKTIKGGAVKEDNSDLKKAPPKSGAARNIEPEVSDDIQF